MDSFNSLERMDLQFNVHIREDAKVKPFADVRAKAAPSPQGLNSSLQHDRLAPSINWPNQSAVGWI